MASTDTRTVVTLEPEPLDVRVRPGILWDGSRYSVGEAGLRIGSAAEDDIVLPDGVAARSHAVVSTERSGGLVVTDSSGVGILVNNEFVQGEAKRIGHGDRIAIGGEQLFVTDGERPIDLDVSSETLSIGSDDSCDIALDHPMVSPLHAVVETGGSVASISDHSSGGGLTVSGVPVQRSQLVPGTEIGIGPFRLVFDGHTVILNSSAAQRLNAVDVSKEIAGHTILHPTTISVAPGDLVAIIGESGAGKSTFLRLLAATDPVTTGSVTLGGEHAAFRRSQLGYVPQDEIVHSELTVQEVLRYAAVLRMPADATSEKIDGAVERIVDELQLTDHVETVVQNLSGGQRKRVGVASELVNRPVVLLLDEPTTGLDPGLESKSMDLFRGLARGSRSVVLVTHATKNLALCDKVLVLAAGGYPCFFGSPADALDFFQVGEFDQIYTALDGPDPHDLMARFEARPERRRARGLAELAATVKAPAARRSQPRRNPVTETTILVSRYLRVLTRDRKNLAMLVGQAPFLGILAALIFPAGAFTNADHARDATNLLFLLTTIAVWLGAISASREIVREKALLTREVAVGVRISSYLASKLGVLWGLCALQVSLMLTCALAVQHPDFSPVQLFALWGCFVIAGATSVSMGLAISAYAQTENQSTTLIPLTLIPQLLFGGAIVAIASMSGAMKLLAGLVYTRWFFAGAGSATDLNARIADDPVFGTASEYGASFFDLPLQALPLMGLLFSATFLMGAALLIRNRDQKVVEVATS